MPSNEKRFRELIAVFKSEDSLTSALAVIEAMFKESNNA